MPAVFRVPITEQHNRCLIILAFTSVALSLASSSIVSTIGVARHCLRADILSTSKSCLMNLLNCSLDCLSPRTMDHQLSDPSPGSQL